MTYSLAEFFDGKSSQSEQVQIQLTSISLLIRSSDGQALGDWSLDRLRDENIPVVDGAVLLSLSEANAARLKIVDPEFLAPLRETCPNLTKRRKADKREWPKLVAGALGTLMIVASLVYFGLPLLSSAIAKMIPETTRQSIGRTVEKQIIKRAGGDAGAEAQICSSSVVDAAFERILNEFSGDISTSILVINSKISNAFALPGGRIILFSGLIEQASSPNALAGVLAHEFAHVESRHPTSLLVANLGMAAILSMAFGDVTGGTIIAGVSQMALGAAYSREFERDADARAIALMRAGNYDLGPLIPLLQKIQKGEPGKGFLSFMQSHPGIESRIQTLKDAGNTGTREVFTDREWQAIKGLCKKSI